MVEVQWNGVVDDVEVGLIELELDEELEIRGAFELDMGAGLVVFPDIEPELPPPHAFNIVREQRTANSFILNWRSHACFNLLLFINVPL